MDALFQRAYFYNPLLLKKKLFDFSFHQKKREVLMKIEGIQAISAPDGQNPHFHSIFLKFEPTGYKLTPAFLDGPLDRRTDKAHH